jgi:hypothetical protein
MRRIDPYALWIGTARDARDVKSVLDAGIEAVVDLAIEEPPARLTREQAYLRFPLTDSDGNASWLLRAAVRAVAELIQSRVPTLVACGAGMSRSPAVVAAAVARLGAKPISAVLSDLPGPIDVSPGLLRELAEVTAGVARGKGEPPLSG